jgi:hypothetical protein
VRVHDGGPDAELMKSTLAARGIDGHAAEAALERYLEDADLGDAVAGVLGPRTSKKVIP